MNEYISKKEVLDYLNGYLHSLGYDNTDLIVNGQRHALINVLEDILTVKAADVQPVRHGQWIWDANAPHREHGAYKCSNCGCHSDFEENYCYNCGTRMDGDSE